MKTFSQIPERDDFLTDTVEVIESFDSATDNLVFVSSSMYGKLLEFSILLELASLMVDAVHVGSGASESSSDEAMRWVLRLLGAETTGLHSTGLESSGGSLPFCFGGVKMLSEISSSLQLLTAERGEELLLEGGGD